MVEEGKDEEWIWLWVALSTCVPEALCALARAIRGCGKKVGSASRKPRSHCIVRTRISSARGTGCIFGVTKRQ